MGHITAPTKMETIENSKFDSATRENIRLSAQSYKAFSLIANYKNNNLD
jgi:hypothetical protein